MVFYLCSTSASAQQPYYEPCYPDCFGSEWEPKPPQPAKTAWVELDCMYANNEHIWAIVYYRTRKACDIWQDLYIESIHFGVAEDGSNCGQSLSLQEMMNNIIEKMIISNPMGFKPKEKGECATNWRIMKGNCWYADFKIAKKTGEKPLPPWGNKEDQLQYWGNMLNCYATTCCLDYYKVCINDDGEKVITHISSEPGTCPSSVPPSYYPHAATECTDVCN